MKSYKVFALLMFCLLFVNMVSALEFDNVKSYDSVKREATFKNSFLGIPTSEIATATLLTPHNVKVAPGYQKVAEIKIEGFTDYDDILKQMKFYDKKNKDSQISRTYDIKWKTTKEVKVDDYEQQCTLLANETQTCEQVKVGFHYETIDYWEKLTPADIKKNEVLILGLFTDVQVGDYVDWVPTFFGVDVPEWATWESSLNTNLVSYYYFNSTLTDELGNFDGTNFGVTFVSGLLDNAGDFEDTEDDYFTTSHILDTDGTAQWSYTSWIKLESTPTSNFKLMNQDYDNTDRGIHFYIDNSRRLNLYSGNVGTCTTTATLSVGTWGFIGGSYFGNGTMVLYVDGTKISCSGITPATDTNNPTYWGRRQSEGATNDFDGQMDMAGIWTRALTDTEYSTLYQNPPPYINQSTGDSYPNVELISPSDLSEYTTSPVSIDFTCYGSDDVNFTEMKLLIDGSIDQTNTTGLNNTNYTFTKSLIDGEYNWTCSGYDNASQETTPTARTFIIDSISPILTLNAPTTNETTSTLPINVTLNVTSTDAHLDSCWYSTNENSTNMTYTCNTTIPVSFSNEGQYTITYCANDTLGGESCDSVSNTIFYYTYEQDSSKDSVGEGDSVTFTLYVNMTDTPDTTATFTINGTEYSSVAKYDFTNYTYFVKTITIPDEWGNSTGNLVDWFWTFNITGMTEENTSTQQLKIYEVAVDDCSAYGTRILNYTLYDEETKSNTLPSALANQSIEIDVLLETYENSSLSWNYSKKETGVNTMDICVPTGLLNFTDYRLGVVTRFKSDDHVVEFHYIDNFNLTISNIPSK